ncbi:MAG: hypothetical protein RIR11_2191 [Bacteroidota bacterium]|jgi:hypothetical protein
MTNILIDTSKLKILKPCWLNFGHQWLEYGNELVFLMLRMFFGKPKYQQINVNLPNEKSIPH